MNFPKQCPIVLLLQADGRQVTGFESEEGRVMRVYGRHEILGKALIYLFNYVYRLRSQVV